MNFKNKDGTWTAIGIASFAFSKVQGRPKRLVKLCCSLQNRFKLRTRVRKHKSVIQIRVKNRGRHSKFTTFMSGKGCQIAQKTSKRAALRYANNVNTFQPYISGLRIDEKQSGETPIIAKRMSTRVKTQMLNYPF